MVRRQEGKSTMNEAPWHRRPLMPWDLSAWATHSIFSYEVENSHLTEGEQKKAFCAWAQSVFDAMDCTQMYAWLREVDADLAAHIASTTESLEVRELERLYALPDFRIRS